MQDQGFVSNFERFSAVRRRPGGPSPLPFVFLFVFSALVVPLLYYYHIQGIVTSGDLAYKRAQWGTAEEAYQKAFKDTTWFGDWRIECSDGSNLFARSQLVEKIALVKSAEGKYEEALPYFERALATNEKYFKKSLRSRSSKSGVGSPNSYAVAQELRRILWNYTQVLVILHRDEEARKLKVAVWSDLLASCSGLRRRRLERLLVSREAQLLTYEGFTPQGDSLTNKLAEIEKLPASLQEEKLLPLLCVTIAPKSNSPLFDTFGVVPQ